MVFTSLSLFAGVSLAAAQSGPAAAPAVTGPVSASVTNNIRFVARPSVSAGEATPALSGPRPARAGLAKWSYTPAYAGQPLSEVLKDSDIRSAVVVPPGLSARTALTIGSLPAAVSNAFPEAVVVVNPSPDRVGSSAAATPTPVTPTPSEAAPMPAFAPLGFPSAVVFPSAAVTTTAPRDAAPLAGTVSGVAAALAPAAKAPKVRLAQGLISPMGKPMANTAESQELPLTIRRASAPAVPAPEPVAAAAAIATNPVVDLPPLAVAAPAAIPVASAPTVVKPLTFAAAAPAPAAAFPGLPVNADEWTLAQARARAAARQAWQADRVSRSEAALGKNSAGLATPRMARGAEPASPVVVIEPPRTETARRDLRNLDAAMNRATVGALDASAVVIPEAGLRPLNVAAPSLNAPVPAPPEGLFTPTIPATPTPSTPANSIGTISSIPAIPAAVTVPMGERKLSLDDCIQEALRHNFDVQIQRLAPQGAKFNLDALSGAYDPTNGLSATHSSNKSPGGNDAQGRPFPSNEITVNNVGPFMRGLLPFGMTYDATVGINQRDGTLVNAAGAQYSTAANISLRQPLLKNFWIDTTRHSILISKRDLTMSEQDLVAQIINSVTAVQQAYYDLIYSRENVKVQEQSLALAQQLLSENKKRVEVGVLAPLDEKQAESQVASVKADLLGAQLGFETAQNALKNLITDDYVAWHRGLIVPAEQMIPIAEPLDLQGSWQKGLTLRPDYAKARLDVEKQDIHLKFYSNQRYPTLDLVGSYGQNGLNGALGNAVYDVRPGGPSPNYSAGVVFSVPLGNRDAKNRYASTKIDKQQSLLRLKKLEQTVMVQIDDAVKQTRIQFERIESTRKAREFAQAAIEAERTKLANGKSTSFVVLQLQRDLTAASSTEIRALTDFNKAVATLAQNEGTTLVRNKLSVEIR